MKTDGNRLTPALICWIIMLLLAQPAGAARPAPSPGRIVSLSPATTEIIFRLGLGDRLVGVTRYCDFPEAARSRPKVGGLLDPNYEEIMALRPDLVILLETHREARRQLEKMGIGVLPTPHGTVSDIHEAIRLIGKACGAERKALALVRDLERASSAVRRAVEKRPRPRVLICIGRDTSTGLLSGMYMAGRNNFYDELIDMAGGINAYTDETVTYPQVSAEGVIEMDPEVIIDLMIRLDDGPTGAERIRHQWDRLSSVSAVRSGRVYLLVGSNALRPGPRYVLFLRKLAGLIHPEAFSGEDGTRD